MAHWWQLLVTEKVQAQELEKDCFSFNKSISSKARRKTTWKSQPCTMIKHLPWLVKVTPSSQTLYSKYSRAEIMGWEPPRNSNISFKDKIPNQGEQGREKKMPNHCSPVKELFSLATLITLVWRYEGPQLLEQTAQLCIHTANTGQGLTALNT